MLGKRKPTTPNPSSSPSERPAARRLGVVLRRALDVVLLAGAVPAAVLALLMQMLFDALDRWLIPAGLR